MQWGPKTGVARLIGARPVRQGRSGENTGVGLSKKGRDRQFQAKNQNPKLGNAAQTEQMGHVSSGSRTRAGAGSGQIKRLWMDC